MQEFRRWYDEIPAVKEVFIVFRNMPEPELGQCSEVLYGVIAERIKKCGNPVDLSIISVEKLQVYYQSYNQRRWYDKNQFIRSSARYLSIMPLDELEIVVNEFMSGLKIRNLNKIYEKNILN